MTILALDPEFLNISLRIIGKRFGIRTSGSADDGDGDTLLETLDCRLFRPLEATTR